MQAALSDQKLGKASLGEDSFEHRSKQNEGCRSIEWGVSNLGGGQRQCVTPDSGAGWWQLDISKNSVWLLYRERGRERHEMRQKREAGAHLGMAL